MVLGMQNDLTDLMHEKVLIVHYSLVGRWSLRLFKRGTVTVSHPCCGFVERSLNDFPLECAKRWTDTLNPAIDRTTWSSEAVSDPLAVARWP